MTSRSRSGPLDLLERIEPFRRIRASGQTLLSQHVVRKRVTPATMLSRKGQPVSGAYLVLDGRLRVFTVAPNGTEATLDSISIRARRVSWR